jgi:hypothetical protein
MWYWELNGCVDYLIIIIYLFHFCQLKGATTSTHELFERKKSRFVKLKIYIANVLQKFITSSHNIERFKQVSIFETCL